LVALRQAGKSRLAISALKAKQAEVAAWKTLVAGLLTNDEPRRRLDVLLHEISCITNELYRAYRTELNFELCVNDKEVGSNTVVILRRDRCELTFLVRNMGTVKADNVSVGFPSSLKESNVVAAGWFKSQSPTFLNQSLAGVGNAGWHLRRLVA